MAMPKEPEKITVECGECGSFLNQAKAQEVTCKDSKGILSKYYFCSLHNKPYNRVENGCGMNPRYYKTVEVNWKGHLLEAMIVEDED